MPKSVCTYCTEYKVNTRLLVETGSRTTNHIVSLGSETLRSARCPTEWTHGYGCNSGVSLFDSERYLNSPPQIVASAIQTHITHRETERRRECVYEVNCSSSWLLLWSCHLISLFFFAGSWSIIPPLSKDSPSLHSCFIVVCSNWFHG